MEVQDVLQEILQETKGIKSNMITKEDTKMLLSKEHLKVFATKEELKAFATKKDIKLILKEIKELKFSISALAEDIAMLDERTRVLVTDKIAK